MKYSYFARKRAADTGQSLNVRITVACSPMPVRVVEILYLKKFTNNLLHYRFSTKQILDFLEILESI